MKFEDFKLSKELIGDIRKLNYVEPTQIQERSIPLILEGNDLIGESATGSGKTLAFGCGAIEKTIRGRGLQVLVLTPTRELADQVKESLRKLSIGKRLKVLSVYGGVSIENQIRNLRDIDILVATPGRFLDHLQRRTVDVSKVEFFVLDEADRMFDMGFINDVERILFACKNRKQTLFFSATISPRIKKLGEKFMKKPITVLAKNMVDPSKLEQTYFNVERNMKLSLLVHLLQNEKSGLVMVFCNTRRGTDFVAKNLNKNGIKAFAIHGGLAQNKRTKTMESFNDARVQVLVCTDVAARGLHISGVSHVYNYDLPKDSKDYVHRIGRTARAGKEGVVINLLSQEDYDNFSRILSDYRDFSIRKLEKPYVKRIVSFRGGDNKRKFENKKRFHGSRRRFSRSTA